MAVENQGKWMQRKRSSLFLTNLLFFTETQTYQRSSQHVHPDYINVGHICRVHGPDEGGPDWSVFLHMNIWCTILTMDCKS